MSDEGSAAAPLAIYRLLLERYGPQRWWPADGPFEMMVGAILTQNTAWVNVERAIHNLKEAQALDPMALDETPIDELARVIRPCGYYNVKARRLKSLVHHLVTDFGGDLGRLFALDTAQLRRELLSIHGVGEETADSIMLYAAQRPVFVVDAYTRRIAGRLGLCPPHASYGDLQALFTGALPADQALLNEYHALLVRHGKEACRPVPRCGGCCLSALCRHHAPPG